MYTREHHLYKKLHNTQNTKKYWIIKKNMRQFDIQKEERKTQNKQSCSKAYSCLEQKTLQF